MDLARLEIIKDSLKKLISNSIWLGTILIIVLFGKIQGLDKVNYGPFTLDSQVTGWFLLLLCVVFTLMITKNYDSIIANFKALENEENRETAKYYLNSYSHILNPFAEEKNSIRTKLLDIWGYTVISFLPLLSTIFGISYINNRSTISLILLLFIFFLIGFFSLERIMTEKHAINLICPNSEKRKRYTAIVILFIGFVFYLLLLFNK